MKVKKVTVKGYKRRGKPVKGYKRKIRPVGRAKITKRIVMYQRRDKYGHVLGLSSKPPKTKKKSVKKKVLKRRKKR